MGLKVRAAPRRAASMDGDNPNNAKRQTGGTRCISSPVAPEDLRPFEPECSKVQIDELLSDADFTRVGELIATDPTRWLQAHWHTDDWVPSLEFLRHFPRLERLQLMLYSGRDLEALRLVPRLTHLYLDKYKHRLSLRPLAALRGLAWVQLESHEHAEVLAELPALRCATLIKLDLRALAGLPTATDAVLIQCRYPIVPPMPRVERLRVSFTATDDNLASLGSMTRLERLSITCIKSLTELPDLSGLRALRELELYDLRSLATIEAVAAIPNLERLELNEVPLPASALRCLADHPRLSSIDVKLSDTAETNRAKAELGLERTGLRRAAAGVQLVEHAPGGYTVTIRDVQMSWDVFDECRHLPNGHTWARLVTRMLADKPPSWRRAVALDAEADGFTARGDNLRAMTWVYDYLVRLAGNDDVLRAELGAL